MKKNQGARNRIKVFATLIVLSMSAISLVRPTPSLASTLATINVQSNIPGVHLIIPTTCFTVSSGTCGITNWTSTSSTNIPVTIYKYPLTATIGGVTYALDPNSLTGCNSGTSGTLPNVCKVFVEFGATATISAHYSVTTPPPPPPPPTPTCYGTANLVKNPSFETVTGTGSGTDQYLQEAAFTQVPHWTVLDANGWGSNDVLNGTPSAWPNLNAYDGVRYLVTPNTYQSTVPEGSVGELSSPLVPYAKYVISAQVDMKQTGSQTPHTFSDFHLRLRNSSTGAMTAIGQTASMYSSTPHWTLITQTVTPTAVYDQVVVQDDTGISAIGFIDDVHVTCKNPGTPWWRASGTLGGVAVFVIIIVICALTLWHNPEFLKSLPTRNKILLGGGVLIVTTCIVGGSVLAINRWGNIFSAKTQDDSTTSNTIFDDTAVNNTTTTNTTAPANETPTNISTNTVANTPVANTTTTNTTTPTPTTPAPAKTCIDTEKLKSGYKLFHNETNKYCIQYPKDWKVDSKNLAEVTFGTVPTGEPGPGWFRVTYFTGKSITTRTEEIQNNFREPAGSCTTSGTSIDGVSGRKLACIGAANGESHIFFLIPEGDNLFEFSYIEGMGENKASYETQYKNMVDSFLCDMFVNK